MSSIFGQVQTMDRNTDIENAKIVHTSDKGWMSWAEAIYTVQRDNSVFCSGLPRKHALCIPIWIMWIDYIQEFCRH